jgi:hypothetical protein
MPGYRRAYRAARRLYPLALAAYHRWEQLEDHEKERYKRQAKRYADQAATYARDAASRTPFPRSGRKRGRRR